LEPNVTRIAFVVCRSAPELSFDYLTFRRADVTGKRPFWLAGAQGDAVQAFAEDVKFRGMHPMIARRLRMWQLANFEITRLPSAPDTYLYECVARTNPADVRLVAVAEIRDLTAVFGADGHVAALPEGEHVL